MPDGDVLLIAGDLTKRGLPNELTVFNAWLETLPYKEIICTYGNHELWVETNLEEAKQILSKAKVLVNEHCRLANGMKVFGSPICKWPIDWAFGVEHHIDRNEIWSNVAFDVDILLTHTPAFGIRDAIPYYSLGVGCDALLGNMYRFDSSKWHVFGHVHEQYGREDHPKNFKHIAVNAAYCGRGYNNEFNSPIVVELND